MTNAMQRGDPDAFDPAVLAGLPTHLTKFKKLKNLQQFEKLPNAPKKAFLAPFPTLQKLWTDLLDPAIRNPIGHHSARHELASGLITFEDGPPMPYIQFAFRTFRLVHVHLLLAHFLKMVAMIPNFKG